MTAAMTVLLAAMASAAPAAGAPETLWLEAEHFEGIRGHCWPMGREAARQTDGRWGLSGPGWAAEWNQGGESGFLSIAAGPGDDAAAVTRAVEIPQAGAYRLWVRYADWREMPERFRVRIEQDGRPAFERVFGAEPRIGEDNVMKLYWGWAFAWDGAEVELEAGAARLTLESAFADPVPRQLDVLVLTTDPSYRPLIKERPRSAAWERLERWREGLPRDLEPLARRGLALDPPAAWAPRTFGDGGFLYLWNVGRDSSATWLSDAPERVPVPYQIRDPDVRAEFERRYAGREDVPIFGDRRIVPTFHGSGPSVFGTGPDGELDDLGRRFAGWLERHPGRPWAMMMNYHPDKPMGEAGLMAYRSHRDRYVGSIAGESLGYFTVAPEAARAATEGAASRRELADAMSGLALAANAAKYKAVFGAEPEGNAYGDVISCLSVGMPAFAPVISAWGPRTIGYESAVFTSALLGMRWAFLRGIARQGGHLTATYRSCNFGDSATMFSASAGYYPYPKNIFDNFYTVYSGAGMTWYKFDIWYQYMAGSSLFYHEQGFDEWWKPGGTTAAGLREAELSPKGKLVDRFLRLTAEGFDRGTPVTPIAFLVDYAHGWEPAPYWPNAFKNWHQQPERWRFGDHERMLENYFWTAYHPIGTMSQQPIGALSEVYVAGVFGDVFDAIAAYPQVERWTTIDTYPVVIAAGEIPLTVDEGRRLAAYVAAGGTLVVADAHLSGPGVAALGLPATDAPREAGAYRWLDGEEESSPAFRYRPIRVGAGERPLAVAPDGGVFCSASDLGEGRLIYLSVPYGMTVSRETMPVVPLLLAHLRQGLLPVEVEGDVQWSLNRTRAGWMVTLINPYGQHKPQQGMTPTDFRENREVAIRVGPTVVRAVDRLLPSESLTVSEGCVRLTVPAGEVRVIELTRSEP